VFNCGTKGVVGALGPHISQAKWSHCTFLTDDTLVAATSHGAIVLLRPPYNPGSRNENVVEILGQFTVHSLASSLLTFAIGRYSLKGI